MGDQKILCYALFVLNDQGGAVMNVSSDKTATLRAQDHGHPPIIFGISPYASNAMKSNNPHSRTIDLNGGNPACNQGGIIVLAAIEGNGSRPSHKGAGINGGKTMYTLNSTEVHAVIVNDS